MATNGLVCFRLEYLAKRATPLSLGLHSRHKQAWSTYNSAQHLGSSLIPLLCLCSPVLDLSYLRTHSFDRLIVILAVSWPSGFSSASMEVTFLALLSCEYPLSSQNST